MSEVLRESLNKSQVNNKCSLDPWIFFITVERNIFSIQENVCASLSVP